MIRLLAPALIALAAPAAAHAAPPAAAQQAGELDRLVAALLPDAAMLDLAARAFDHGVEKGAVDDAELRRLYARHSGLKAGIADPVRAELRKILKRELPSLRKEIRAILASELSAKERSDAAAFFTSPAGQRAYAAAVQAIGENPERSEKQQAEAATQAVMKNMAARDLPAILAFGASSASRKMNSTINPRVGAASRAWSERVIAKNAGKVTKVARRAAKKFVKAQGRKA